MYFALVSLLTLLAPFTSSSRHLASLLRKISCFPPTLLAVFSTNRSHPFVILAPAPSVSFPYQQYQHFGTAQIIPLHSWSSVLETLAVFLLFLAYLLSICTTSYPIYSSSYDLLAFCPCSTMICSSHALYAYAHIHLLTISKLYHCAVLNGAFSLVLNLLLHLH